jgi:hypothetical protein
MNAVTPPEILLQTDQAHEPGSRGLSRGPRWGPLLRAACKGEQAQARHPLGPGDERGFETFVDGASIRPARPVQARR